MLVGWLVDRQVDEPAHEQASKLPLGMQLASTCECVPRTACITHDVTWPWLAPRQIPEIKADSRTKMARVLMKVPETLHIRRRSAPSHVIEE